MIEFFIQMFSVWIQIFAAPLQNPSMLWILVPTYFNFFFTEFYQEKHGTSLGNAISNSLIPLWVGWDWARTLYHGYTSNEITPDFSSFIKIVIAAAMLFYGFHLLIQGIKLSERVKFIGRIRVVTYVVLMLTPFFYGIFHFELVSALAIVVFFPLYYFTIELIDKVMPDPKAFKADQQPKEEFDEQVFVMDQPQKPQNDFRYAPPQYQQPMQRQVRR